MPKMWPRGECFILGGGPSLRLIDVERLRGRRVIAVNQAYQLGKWIDVLFYGDCRWLLWNQKELLDWPGLKVTCCEAHNGKPGIRAVLRESRPFGICRDPSRVSWNLSSGAAAINLAVHFGVRRIVLLGYDMRKIEDEHNWHDEYKKRININAKRDPYQRFLRPFPDIAKGLERAGVECVNATPGSAIGQFPIVDPEEVL
ncbi:MAG: hypothetical protein ACYTFZ_10285 [Planctomycetota bacterium]